MQNVSWSPIFLNPINNLDIPSHSHISSSESSSSESGNVNSDHCLEKLGIQGTCFELSSQFQEDKNRRKNTHTHTQSWLFSCWLFWVWCLPKSGFNPRSPEKRHVKPVIRYWDRSLCFEIEVEMFLMRTVHKILIFYSFTISRAIFEVDLKGLVYIKELLQGSKECLPLRQWILFFFLSLSRPHTNKHIHNLKNGLKRSYNNPRLFSW